MAEYRESTIGVSPKVDYFKLPPSQEGFMRGHIIEHRPVNQITDEGPYDILIPGNSEFVDLANTNLYVKMKMVDSVTGDDFDDTVAIGSINNMMNSLFSQIDVELNGVLVSTNTQHHAYRSYLRTLLENNLRVKHTRLGAAGWYKDVAEDFDDVDAVDSSNWGIYNRYSLLKESAPVALYGKINTDMSTCDRYIPPGVDILIRLWRTKDLFFFLQLASVTVTAKVKMLDVYMDVKKVNPSSDFVLGFEKGLSNTPALLPYQRSRIQTYNLPTGTISKKEDLVFQNEIPDIFVCGMVKSTAFSGNLQLNPYNFRTVGLSQITFYIDDVALPAKNYRAELSGESQAYSAQLYDNLFTAFGQRDRSQFDNDITIKDYQGGNALYVINVRAAIDAEMLHVKKNGNFKIELQFAPLPESNTLICMGLFQDVFAIDGSRNIIRHLTPS